MHISRGGVEREGQRISSRLECVEPDTGLNLMDHEIMT